MVCTHSKTFSHPFSFCFQTLSALITFGKFLELLEKLRTCSKGLETSCMAVLLPVEYRSWKTCLVSLHKTILKNAFLELYVNSHLKLFFPKQSKNSKMCVSILRSTFTPKNIPQTKIKNPVPQDIFSALKNKLILIVCLCYLIQIMLLKSKQNQFI